MEVFGARAYVHGPKQCRYKLDSRLKACTSLECEPSSKAYRVLLDADKMVVGSSYSTRPPQTAAMFHEVLSSLKEGNFRIGTRLKHMLHALQTMWSDTL